jgi:hypothetical protein
MFRRGFKAWCEETALNVRQHQGLPATAPLSPHLLASELRVAVVQPSDLKDLSADVCRRLLGKHSDCWSAMTIPGKRPLIVYNPAHSAARQNSDLMHELAHVLLGHKPTRVFIDPHTGLALRTHDKEQEEEASWLAGSLMLPREVLLHIKANSISDEAACRQYGVSAKMLTYRMNVSGVNIQQKRAQVWRR